MKNHSTLMCLKHLKLKLKINLNKSIKSVRSDCGGEYYNRYDGSHEQSQGPFARYLEECGIVP